MKRGEIWWAKLPDARGSEPAFRRPVLILQSDPFNQSRIGTVIVAAITSNMRLSAAPGNVRLTRRQSRLAKESVVNVSQVLTIDRTFISKRVSRIPAARLTEVEAGLRLTLAL